MAVSVVIVVDVIVVRVVVIVVSVVRVVVIVVRVVVVVGGGVGGGTGGGTGTGAGTVVGSVPKARFGVQVRRRARNSAARGARYADELAVVPPPTPLLLPSSAI